MLRYMLDTSICVHVLKHRPPELRDRFNSLADQLCVSAVTLAELLFGAEKSARVRENLAAVEHFRARLGVLPFAERAAAHFGQIRAELERTGRPAGSYDTMIGGHARAEGLVLVTNNRREFDCMSGLRVEDWLG